ncbi:MAG: CPBP family intramembrane glutamic endopeptidase [Opitutales bacterium]|jgi:hypothetical protein
MPQIIPNDWTSPQFIEAAYSVALLGLGTISIIYLLLQRQRWRGLPPPGARVWQIGWLDMGILFCLLFMWSVLVGSITMHIMPAADGADEPLRVWRAALDGFLLQIGIAVIFIFFWIAQPFQNRLSFNSARMESGPAFRKALLFFLAFTPLRFLLEAAWLGLIGQLGKLGIEVPLDEQSAVGLFDGRTPPLAFAAMLLLAALIAPVVEELVFRAGLYRFLKGRMRQNTAIIISAALFATLHANVMAFPTLMFLGVALCVAYESTGNIKVPMFFHAIFNVNSIFLIVLQSLHGKV